MPRFRFAALLSVLPVSTAHPSGGGGAGYFPPGHAAQLLPPAILGTTHSRTPWKQPMRAGCSSMHGSTLGRRDLAFRQVPGLY
ncbi:MAG TPA: hypothetical protein VNU46_04475 [Gemmatimonadaceae bacterium]|nr:hypothetical protein [Gemmatimonadaceae bacterium]